MIKVSKDGQILDGSDPHKVQLALIQQHAQLQVAAVAAFTDSGGGTNNSLIYLSAPLVEVANSGSQLADKTTAEAAGVKVKNALTELAAMANTYATALGLPTFTNSIGGTAADGTIDALDSATGAGAATGIQDTEFNAYIAAVNKDLNSIRAKVNTLSRALGYSDVGVSKDTGVDDPALLTTLPALATSFGTAASPGLTKVQVDAVLLKQKNSVKALSVALDRLTAPRTPLVLIV